MQGKGPILSPKTCILIQKRHPYTGNLNSRDLEDAEANTGGDNSVWHGRQSKDERLADAAESRLLGLAAKPPPKVHSIQQDMEPRHNQPVSYARREVQV